MTILKKRIKKMGMYLLILVLLLAVFFVGMGYILSAPGYQGATSDHFDGTRFKNSNGNKANDLKDLFKFLRTRKPRKWTDTYESSTYPEAIQNSPSEALRIIFVNHSTFLIQIDGLNILTDPIWSERCSPFQWMGPKRHRPPGIPFEYLPKIDVVLISHNHYDHLDVATIKRLQEKFSPQFIVPLGVDLQFRKMKIDHVTALDWNDNTEFKGLAITATEAVHFSSRGAFDRDKTLWCGFVLEGSKKLYYAGDTGYDQKLFKRLGQTYQNLDIAILPIGAYKPNWFMSPIHTSPEEAVQIHIDMQPKQSIATHFGTFALADEGQGEAPATLRKVLLEKMIDTTQFIAPEEGVLYEY